MSIHVALNHVTHYRYDRPVAFLHGDTHIFRVDKPLYDDAGLLVENLTRVEPFGHPYVHWVRVLVRPDEPQVFGFRQELVPGNVGNVVAAVAVKHPFTPHPSRR